MLKLERKARGHFVTLIEISVHFWTFPSSDRTLVRIKALLLIELAILLFEQR